MNKYIRFYSYLVLVCFIVNTTTMNMAYAWDAKAMEDMLMSPEVIKGVFGGQVATQSESADMNQQVAPPPKVITTSNGDMYIYSGSGASAQVSKTAEGYTEVSYTLNGATVKVKNDETGESLNYTYELDGATVKLYNDNGALVETRQYSQYGQLLSTSAQGLVTYEYGVDKNGAEIMVSSTDQWGNKTIYDEQSRPDYIMYTNMDGAAVEVGNYTYSSKGILQTFTDQNGNTTHFEQDGIRPSYVSNLQGTITKTFQYNTDEILVSVTDVISGQITEVVNGYYTTIFDVINAVDAEGNDVIDPITNQPVVDRLVPVGAYNYDAANNISSITTLGQEGVVTGWTDYNESGQVIGTYNHEGVLIQNYVYNEHGFLEKTLSLGSVTDSGYQATTSMTLFDKQGRPAEVWQIGDGGNKVKIQEYVYKANGVMESTYSLGIIRGTDENNPQTYGQPILDGAGNFQYIRTSKTEYDKKGRPEAVYALVRDAAGNMISGYDVEGNAIITTDSSAAIMEKQQAYKYNSNGFLSETLSYGFGGRVNGTTKFDRYSRPTTATNAQGAVSQIFIYGTDGFLTQTLNRGENGVTTGYTLYNDKGKPTDVYNHKDSLVQKYVYDSSGMLVQSLTLSGAEGVNENIASTQADQDAITALWNSSYTGDAIAATGGNLSDSAFVTAMWNAWNSGDTELTEKIALTIITWFSDGAKGGNEYLINSVGTAYHMLGQCLEQEGNSAVAISAYKVQVSEFGGARAWNAAGTVLENVTDWSVSQLSNSTDRPAGDQNLPEVNLATVTGYTVFGGDGKPMASYSMYEKFDENGASLGIQSAKTQDFSYSYESSERKATGEVDANGRAIYVDVAVTKHSNFVQQTTNFGDFYDSNGDGVITFSGANKDEQAVTGYTKFDNYGRQNETFNDENQVVQKYSYSTDGFLKSTISYGANKRVTGITVFDNYSRPVAAYNNYGSKASSLPDDLVAALDEGLTVSDLENPAWQPYLKGLTQTFVYGDDGFLQSSLTWGEATAIDLNKIDKFTEALGAVRGDKTYSADYDFNDDGAIDAVDQAMFEEAFNGSTAFSAAYKSVAGNANFNAAYDYDADGDIDRTDLIKFTQLTTNNNTAKYMPTYTGKTDYDKYGKATAVENAEGIIVQQYVYNERGFMTMSESYGALTDENGNIMLDSANQVITIRTGYTEFNEKSKPVATYSVYNDGTNGEQSAKVQEYIYKDGFMVQTNNFGRNGVDNGYTTFDDYGRQKTTYNDENQVVSKYVYSNQGFLKQTSNYGLGGAYTGKTVFNKLGRPTEAFNMAGSTTGLKGLTQTFEYNQYGFLSSSTSYGENQAMTGKTVYDGYGKAIRGENDMGMTVSSYEYDSQGFMTKTTSLAFVQNDSATGQYAVDVTHNNLNDQSDALNGTTQHGFYTVTGYTEFDDNSRPIASYQCYWADEQTGVSDFALIQSYTYDKGFLVSTTNYGKDGIVTGRTDFDKYGRQSASYNEFDEVTTKYRYSTQGFMDTAYNYGLAKAVTGKTVFNDLGRPEASYNNRGSLVQDFHYNSFTGAMDSSRTYGEPSMQNGVMQPTWTGTTTYDAYGKALEQTNEFGVKVADYAYDSQGFMTRANSYGNNEALTGYTEYNGAGRPVGSYTVSESGIATKVQDFIYNTNATADPSSVELVNQPANTGFLTMTVSYGDPGSGQLGPVTGYTTFNKYGQQEKSYNELGEQTTTFRYSRAGFMSETLNYGVGKTFTGKTVFNEYGRPVAAYNERNALVQDFQYSNGFLVTSTSYGDPGTEAKGPVTGITYYNDFGKQTHTKNAEGYTVSGFSYNERGFMTRSTNLAFVQDNAATGQWAVDETNANGVTEHGYYQVVGYTEYDAKSRPTLSYSVYNGIASVSQKFVYNTDWDGKSDFNGAANTGFVTGAIMYSMDTKGTASTADDVQVYTGTSVYNKYGRPELTYNHLGVQTSKNYYSRNGFIEKTINYGEDKAVTGSLVYDNTGRPTESLNFRGVMTTKYFYNHRGQLAQTVNYNNSIETSYTTFDVYSKATATYQLYSGTYADPHGYQYNAGGTKNYTANADGSIASGGFKNQENVYNIYGGIERTNSYGRQGGLVSHITYDVYSRPNQVFNQNNALVQEYTYSAQGFLSYTTSFADMKAYDDKGNPVADGNWDSSETTRTYFNKYGQQTKTYLMVGNSTDGFTQGAVQAEYFYDSNGFLSKSVNYTEGTVSSWVTFDPSGRQNFSYNAQGGLSGTFFYDANGFLTRTTSNG